MASGATGGAVLPLVAARSPLSAGPIGDPEGAGTGPVGTGRSTVPAGSRTAGSRGGAADVRPLAALRPFVPFAAAGCASAFPQNLQNCALASVEALQRVQVRVASREPDVSCTAPIGTTGRAGVCGAGGVVTGAAGAAGVAMAAAVAGGAAGRAVPVAGGAAGRAVPVGAAGSSVLPHEVQYRSPAALSVSQIRHRRSDPPLRASACGVVKTFGAGGAARGGTVCGAAACAGAGGGPYASLPPSPIGGVGGAIRGPSRCPHSWQNVRCAAFSRPQVMHVMTSGFLHAFCSRRMGRSAPRVEKSSNASAVAKSRSP
jgi:hypothetical protein